MKCPSCGETMEYENAPLAVSSYGSEKRSIKVQHQPSAHYRCDSCDAEYIWIKPMKKDPWWWNAPAFRMIDGRDFDQADNYSYGPWWRPWPKEQEKDDE